MINKKEKLFGTDGIRGVPGQYPLTDGMVFKIGIGLCRYLTYKAVDKDKKLRIVIGKDTRLSGNRIEMILTNAFTSFGIDVLIAGIIPTPGISFLVDKLDIDLGVMISASHNRSQDNGMKFFISKGQKILFSDEEWIEDIIFGHMIQKFVDSEFNGKGEIRRLEDEILEYKEFLKSSGNIDAGDLKICLDLNWGATSEFAKDVFESFGAEVSSINDTPRGENINSSSLNGYQELKDKVLSEEANIGFAFDGDGDRVTVVDGEGNLLDGDDILGILAKYLLDKDELPKNSIVTTQMSNIGIRRYLSSIGIKVILSEVGDKNVLEKIIKNGLNLGGEPTGHIIFPELLHTPDGMLTAILLLKVLKDTDKSLSQLAVEVGKLPQAVANIPVKDKVDFKNITSVSEQVTYFNSQLKSQGRVFLRYSRTENVARLKVEAESKETAQRIADCLSSLIVKEIGLEGHKQGIDTGCQIPDARIKDLAPRIKKI